MKRPKNSATAEAPASRGAAAPKLALAAAAVAACLSWSLPASAQTGVEAASSTGKGIAAGVLLGAETVVLAEAVVGIRPRWAYLVGAGVGAVGGGVGGYFLEDKLSPRTATFLLAGGIVLAIPATVAALSASAYRPPLDYIQDEPPVDEPPDAPPRPEVTSDRPQHTLPRLASFVEVDEGRWSLGVPPVMLLDVYSPELRLTYGFERETELRVPVLAGRF